MVNWVELLFCSCSIALLPSIVSHLLSRRSYSSSRFAKLSVRAKSLDDEQYSFVP